MSDPQARFHDLGPQFYANRTGPDRKKRNHFRQLEALGYKVTLEPAAGRRFARRAAIRDGQAVVRCTVPG